MTAAWGRSCASARPNPAFASSYCLWARRAQDRNTATFDDDGNLWFTAQSGVIGTLALETGTLTLQDAPHVAPLTASARRRPARSGGVRSPARSSPASTGAGAHRSSSSRRRGTRARAVSGATVGVAFGSANGRVATCRCTIRPPRPGAPGRCRLAFQVRRARMSSSRYPPRLCSKGENP